MCVEELEIGEVAGEILVGGLDLGAIGCGVGCDVGGSGCVSGADGDGGVGGNLGGACLPGEAVEGGDVGGAEASEGGEGLEAEGVAAGEEAEGEGDDCDAEKACGHVRRLS